MKGDEETTKVFQQNICFIVATVFINYYKTLALCKRLLTLLPKNYIPVYDYYI